MTSLNRGWMGLVAIVLACGGRVATEVAPDKPIGDGDSYAAGGSGTSTPATSTDSPLALPPGASGGATWFGVGGAVAVMTGGTGGSAIVPPSSTATACSSSTNLIAAAALSGGGDWVDGVCWVRGAIYAFSDQGLDGIDGTPDDTVQSPAVDANYQGTNVQRFSPCNGGRCCISGETHAWPVLGTGTTPDYLASVWGGGIGLGLNRSADGSAMPYNGNHVLGFQVTLSGTLSGQALRIAYSQVPGDSSAPFLLARLGKNTVYFEDVGCPSWASDCVTPSSNPYDLQIQIVGGDDAGPFELCVTSIAPIVEFLL